MNLITPFDPWKSKMCTCPEKYSFNPYTGCDHKCRYCYSTYIPNFYNARPKKRLLIRLEKELRNLPKNALISMSNSSDPYPPMETELEITRKSIELIREKNLRLMVITKSDIVLRDVDVIKNMRAVVAITVTTLDEEISGKLEPFAPKPKKRIDALKKLKKSGIPVILRLDPVIPLLTDDSIDDVLEKSKFVDHVVTSTLKLRGDSYSRISESFPELKELYRELYFKKGEKIGGSWYLPKVIRDYLLSKVVNKCEELGLSYAFCREGAPFKAKSCDGSHLI